MRKRYLLPLILLLIVAAFGLIWLDRAPKEKPPMTDVKLESGTLQLRSSAFTENGDIPAKYTCQGDNINPPLTISGAPADAQSFVLILHDPDAPGGDWVHWTLWNIESSVTQIAEGSEPVGSVAGTTSFGNPGYSGPCPPSGRHHYIFEVYALDTKLDLPSSTTRDQLSAAMSGHILAETKLTGLFGS